MSVLADLRSALASEPGGPRGAAATDPERDTVADGGPRLPVAWLPWALVLVAAAVCRLDPGVPLLQPVAGVVLLAIPVVVLARRLPWRLSTPVHAGVLGLGLTVLGIIAGGLLLTTVLPLLGVARPLDPGPVTVAVVAADLALLAWRPSVPLLPSPRPGLHHEVVDQIVELRFRLLPTLVVATLVLTVVGAVRLNNGAGGAVAVAGHLGAVAVLVVAFLARDERLGRDVVAVATAGLSLLLATSLRSWYVSGHDVQREFISFQLVHGSGRWSMADYESAYHACLSVNILPTVLAGLTDLPGTVLFKIVLQLLAATLPVVVLLLAREILDRRLALVAAGVFMAFPTFSSDMPFLVRQEVAFLFFGLALLVVTQVAVPPRTRWLLVFSLLVGVVLSHYSTTYLTIATLRNKR